MTVAAHVVRPVKDAALFLLHRSFAAAAAELKPEALAGALLVIAPHADDETLGCAAVILRASQAGRRICVIIVSDGSQSIQSAVISPQQLAALRIEEAVAAAGVLGVAKADVAFLGFSDSRLEAHKPDIAEALSNHIAALKPTQIYTPYGIDGHQDHRALAAVVDLLVRTGRVTCPIYEYPIWFWPWDALRHLAMPSRLRRVSTTGCLPTKNQAMLAYRSQCENITGEAGTWFLDKKFLSNFFRPNELFFEKPRRGEPAPNA